MALSAHDRDKAIALFKSIAAECETKGSDPDHAWRKCRHCLAVQELDHEDVRELLRGFVAAINAPSWTCFHCGETFEDEATARDHFGDDEIAIAACRIAGADGGLLKALRESEREVGKLQQANEQLDHEAGAYHAMSAELERLFGKGATTAHQAWLRLEEMESRAMAAEEQLAAVKASQTDDERRCAVCGWPIYDSVDAGCVRGNCSQRPLPERFYAPVRAKAEYHGLFDNDPRCAPRRP